MSELDQRAMHSLRSSVDNLQSSVSSQGDALHQLNCTLQETNTLLYDIIRTLKLKLKRESGE